MEVITQPAPGLIKGFVTFFGGGGAGQPFCDESIFRPTLVTWSASVARATRVTAPRVTLSPTTGSPLVRLAKHSASDRSGDSSSNSTPYICSTSPNRASPLSTKSRSEEHTSELQSRPHLVCRL